MTDAPDVIQIGLRVKESLRAKLMEAAAKNHNSMNGEIVRRLEASFAEGGVVHEIFGGEANLLLAQMLCRHLQTIHPDIKYDDWAYDQAKYEAVRAHFEKHGSPAIVKMLDYIVEDQTGFDRDTKIEPLPKFKKKER